MSISELLTLNTYGVQMNSAYVITSFSAVPSGSQSLTVFPEKLTFATGLLTNGNYSTSTSTFTVPESGVYTFNCMVEYQYEPSAPGPADVIVKANLLNGAAVLMESVSTVYGAKNGVQTNISLPVYWSGFLAQGDLITLSCPTPSVSAGTLTLSKVAAGSLFSGKASS